DADARVPALARAADDFVTELALGRQREEGARRVERGADRRVGDAVAAHADETDLLEGAAQLAREHLVGRRRDVDHWDARGQWSPSRSNGFIARRASLAAFPTLGYALRPPGRFSGNGRVAACVRGALEKTNEATMVGGRGGSDLRNRLGTGCRGLRREDPQRLIQADERREGGSEGRRLPRADRPLLEDL